MARSARSFMLCMASFRMLSTMSTFSNVAFSPIRPMRKTCSTVGPKPPLTSRLYLQKSVEKKGGLVTCKKAQSGLLLAHGIVGNLAPVNTEGHFDGVHSR